MATLMFDLDQLDSDSEPDRRQTGQWRLSRIELVNWGTFAGHVAIEIAREGHLFTGASGSGKSSLLDAITTVLTPDRWLRLNAAAQDASSRQGDRSLMSYVRGAWTREADENTDRTMTTHLRPRATWSGILLRYEDLQNAPVLLGRVFHAPGTRTDSASLKDARLFVRGDLALLDLKPHVENGIDARRMTAAIPDALITTGGRHGRFHERVVRQFGFRSDTTLQLLHRTQSAKNLGTLDALFRGFMLDAPDTFARSDNAVEQFTELDRAHAHVVDLRRQADALRRVDESITAYDAASAETSALAALYNAVDPYTVRLRSRLAHGALRPARAVVARAESTARETARELALARDALETAKARVRNEGGARVEVLRAGVTAAELQEHTVTRERDRVAAELATIGAPFPNDAEEFAELAATAMTESTREVPAVAFEVRDQASEARKALDAVQRRLRELRDHRSNLDARLLAVRSLLADTLGLPESALPFAGELLQVLPEHAGWRGAIERVLAPLATTLLVAEEHLAPVRRAVEGRHLGVRLVIEAAKIDAAEPRRPKDPRSLRHRVEVARGPFASHLRQRLATDFDYACVEHPDELDGVERGVTAGGLLKRSSRRYEKDDRSGVTDATRWMLGGDTEARLDALLARREEAEAQARTTAAADARADAERESALARRGVFQRIAELTWASVDIASAAAETAAHRAELTALTSGSLALRDAQEAHDRAEERASVADTSHAGSLRSEGAARDALARIETQLAELEASPVEPLDEAVSGRLDVRFRAVKRSLTLDNADAVAREVLGALSREKDAATRCRGDAESRFAARAADFRATWPTVGTELTTEIGDRAGYRELLEGILARGLPEKEGEFRRLLRERSRDVVAHLLDDLRSAPGLIRDRILPVNASLGRSPFEGTDRFLEIDVRMARTPEVEEFLSDLRRIVEGNWADESAAGAEQRFAVLQRVVGRLGSKDRVDLDWRTRMLDTRLHVSFLAREKDVTGRVLRVYDSSEGLSGGQRQKLVIFCLAAALRYQLTEEEDDAPRFGSIMLDEAFDKADSRYTRNAMEVFREFGFHMILATPQKLLQTLEPYVGAITSVSNPDRRASRLANVVFQAPGAADEAAVIPPDAGPSADAAAGAAEPAG